MESLDTLPEIKAIRDGDGNELYNKSDVTTETEEESVEETDELEEESVEEEVEDSTEDQEEEEIESEETDEVEETDELEEESTDEVEEEDESLMEEIEEDLELEGVDFSAISQGMVQDEAELTELFELLNDPYLKEAIEYYKAEKTLEPYAMAKTFGSEDYWSKIPDEQVIMEELRSAYQGEDFTQDEIDLLVESDFNQYDTSDEDLNDKEVERRKLKLRLQANKVRKQNVAEFSKFAAPKVREEQPAAKSPEVIERERIQATNKAKSSLKSQLDKNKLSFKAGDVDVSLEINPKSLIETGLSQKKIIQSIFTESKELDWKKIAFLNDPDSFIAAIQNSSSVEATKDFVAKNLKNKPSKGKSDSKTLPRVNGLPHPANWKIKS
jgi:hypothetical protein